MGILKAAAASASSMAADQWKEYFYCDAIPADILMVRARRMSAEKGVNHGSEDIVTDGSVIAVADGETAIVVSNGKLIAEYREPGEHKFKSGDTASVFGGSGLKGLGKEFGRRFSFGGEAPPVTHRVYYLNMKEMPGETVTDSGIPFRFYDEDRSIDIDCTLSVSAYYTYRIADPVKIYKQLMGNIEHVYRASYLLRVMGNEVRSILLAAFGQIAGEGMRSSQIGERLPEIEERIRELTKEKICEARGIEFVSVGITAFSLTEKDSGIVRDFQKMAVLRDPAMANAALASAHAEALPLAAANSAGALPLVAAQMTVAPEAAAAQAESGAALREETAAQAESATVKAAGRPKFCTECGARLEGGKFCRECGHPIGA